MEQMTFKVEEQETTIAFYRNDKKIVVYTSDRTMITRLSKVTNEIEVLTVDNNNSPTSANFTLDIKQLSFRKKTNLNDKSIKE